jgi:hypothetical protein
VHRDDAGMHSGGDDDFERAWNLRIGDPRELSRLFKGHPHAEDLVDLFRHCFDDDKEDVRRQYLKQWPLSRSAVWS